MNAVIILFGTCQQLSMRPQHRNPEALGGAQPHRGLGEVLGGWMSPDRWEGSPLGKGSLVRVLGHESDFVKAWKPTTGDEVMLEHRGPWVPMWDGLGEHSNWRLYIKTFKQVWWEPLLRLTSTGDPQGNGEREKYFRVTSYPLLRLYRVSRKRVLITRVLSSLRKGMCCCPCKQSANL